jgi:hypothetical protein
MLAKNPLSVFKEWSSFTSTQQWSIGFTAFSAIVGAVLYAVFVKENSLTYCSIIIWSAATLMFDRITRYSFENRANLEMEKFNLARPDLRCLGTSVEGIRWFCDNLDGLAAIDNTIFNRVRGGFVWIPEEMEKYVAGFKKSLENGCYLRDLVLDTQKSAVVEFYQSLNEKQKKGYNAAELSTTVPLFQMMILKYHSSRVRSDVVLFGWTTIDPRDSKVFLSSDVGTVSYFEKYFDEVYKHHATHLYGYDFSPHRPAPPAPPSSPKASINYHILCATVPSRAKRRKYS